MKHEIIPMDPKATLLVSTWKYPPPYAIYNMESDPETVAEMLNGTFYSVYENHEMMGYFCFGKSARISWAEVNGYYPSGYTDIGLAMRPDLIGRGLGLEFFKLGMDFARTIYPYQPIRLTVASFNVRAQKVYQRAGFIEVGSFTVPGGLMFIIMVQGPVPEDSQ